MKSNRFQVCTVSPSSAAALVLLTAPLFPPTSNRQICLYSPFSGPSQPPYPSLLEVCPPCLILSLPKKTPQKPNQPTKQTRSRGANEKVLLYPMPAKPLLPPVRPSTEQALPIFSPASSLLSRLPTALVLLLLSTFLQGKPGPPQFKRC